MHFKTRVQKLHQELVTDQDLAIIVANVGSWCYGLGGFQYYYVNRAMYDRKGVFFELFEGHHQQAQYV